MFLPKRWGQKFERGKSVARVGLWSLGRDRFSGDAFAGSLEKVLMPNAGTPASSGTAGKIPGPLASLAGHIRPGRPAQCRHTDPGHRKTARSNSNTD
jgi:hypothetical protein